VRIEPPEPPLTDGVVVLRVPRPRDASVLSLDRGDPEIQRWIFGGPAEPNEIAARRVVDQLRRFWRDGLVCSFSIREVGIDEHAGLVSLQLDSRRHGVAELGYGLGARARGRGLATRAAALVARWAFEEVAIARLEARTHPENLASQRVLERLGFTREGIERAARSFTQTGERYDCVCWSLLPGELPEVRDL
jgi:RimJ/RimL family protein N-acetyltransferase